MPDYFDKIQLDDDLSRFDIHGEFKFSIEKYSQDFDMLFLKKNNCGYYEFLSRTTLLIPRENFGSGDKISLYTWKGEVVAQHLLVKSREPYKATEQHFGYLKLEDTENNARFLCFACEIEYSEAEMNWILLGYIPEDMSDRILIYSKDDKIFIYTYLGGNLIYEARFKRKSDGRYLIYQLHAVKRNVEFSKYDFISIFKGYLDNTLNNKKYLEKWSKEFMMKL